MGQSLDEYNNRNIKEKKEITHKIKDINDIFKEE